MNLKTSAMPSIDCLRLLAVAVIPLLVLEILKMAQHQHGLWRK